MMKTKILLLILMLVFAVGCGSAKVRLNYVLGAPMGKECSGSVMVLKFKDARGNDSLGADSDGKPVLTDDDVAEWASWALYEELGNAGCDVKYHEKREGFMADTIVSGEVNAASIKEVNTTVWRGSVRVTVTVEHGGNAVVQTFTSEVQDTTVMSSSRQEIMAEALRGVLAEIVPMVIRNAAK